MAVCPIDEKGYCSRHKTVHYGRKLELSQQDDEAGEKYRLVWDRKLQSFEAQGGPSPLGQVLNFGKAFWTDVKNWMPRVSDEVYAQRLAACETCEAYCDKSVEGWRCNHVECGCRLKEHVILPGKARWGAETCPIGRWPLPTVPAPVVGKCGCGS